MALRSEITHHRFTVDDYHRMIEAGVLTTEDSVEHGITEVWLVDLEANVVEVYREPTAASYRNVAHVTRGSSISPSALPDIVRSVDDILG